MSDIATMVDRYISLWNEPAAPARARSIAEIFTADATYTDPLANVSGHVRIGALITGIRSQFIGYMAKLLTAVDGTYHIARFSWELVPIQGGEALVIGSAVMVFAEDGKIRSVYGFLDRVPAA